MSAYSIWAGGLRRAWHTPAMLLLVWLLTFVVAAVPAAFLGSAIQAHLDDSLEAEAAAESVNYDWLQEFRSSGSSLARSLRPDVIGFAAVLDNISALADQSARSLIPVAAGVLFVIVVWFMSPGIIDRLAAGSPLGAAHFLSRCGAAAGPMLRLGVVAAFAYGTLLLSLHPWMFDQIFDRLTRDVTVERTAFFIRFGFYAAFFLAVAALNLLFDVARTRLVLERRRSAFGAVVAGAVFLVAHFRTVAGQYVLNVTAFVAVVIAYAMVAPGAGRADWTMWASFALGQLYIGGRILVRLSFMGGVAEALAAAFGRPRAFRTWSRELPY